MSSYCGQFLYSAVQFSHTALAGTDSTPLQGDLQVSILCVFAETLHIGVFVLQRSNHAVIITSTFHDIGETCSSQSF